MTEMLPPPQLDPEAVMVGADVVRIEDGKLVIYSKRDMPDWVVRGYSRPAIWFKEQKLYLRAKTPAAKPFHWKYTLCPWTETTPETVPYAIYYDEDYVRERDEDFKEQLAADSVHWVLLPLYPLLGLLWSGVKERLETFGFNPRSVTSASVALEFGIALCWGIYVGWLGQVSAFNYALLLVLAIDLVIRYDAVLGDKPRQPGFLEWRW